MAKADNWTLTIKLERRVKAGAKRGYKVSREDAASFAGNIVANSLSRLPAGARVQLNYEIDGQTT